MVIILRFSFFIDCYCLLISTVIKTRPWVAEGQPVAIVSENTTYDFMLFTLLYNQSKTTPAISQSTKTQAAGITLAISVKL